MAIRKPTRVYKDIDLSLKKNPNTKDISKKVDVPAVKQALKILVNTQFTEKPFQPLFGSQVRGLLFEPMSHSTSSLLASVIELAIQNFEPRARVEDVTVIANHDQNSYEVVISFFVRGVRDLQELGLVLERLR